MVSRSPLLFLQRKEILGTFRPSPRFAPSDLLVNKYPIGQTLGVARLAEGDPPPLRATMKEWAPS